MSFCSWSIFITFVFAYMHAYMHTYVHMQNPAFPPSVKLSASPGNCQEQSGAPEPHMVGWLPDIFPVDSRTYEPSKSLSNVWGFLFGCLFVFLVNEIFNCNLEESPSQGLWEERCGACFHEQSPLPSIWKLSILLLALLSSISQAAAHCNKRIVPSLHILIVGKKSA